MSQRMFRAPNGRSASTGYDRPLDYFFLTILQDSTPIYSNLNEEDPALDYDDIEAVLREFEMKSPPTLYIDLADDKERETAAGRSFIVFDYGIVGAAPPHSHVCPMCPSANQTWSHDADAPCQFTWTRDVRERLCPTHYVRVAESAIPFMREQKLYDAEMGYPNYHNGNAHCHIELWRDDEGNAAVICTEVNDNEGTSVTNQCEVIASIIIEHFKLDPLRLTWIEHYPDHHANIFDEMCSEHFSLVKFARILRKPERLPRWSVSVREPQWSPLTFDDPRLTALEGRAKWDTSDARRRFIASRARVAATRE
jgi:hypothetical protein